MPDTVQAISEATALPPHKSALLSACLSAGCLAFGNFTLKSGRQSPYFFNAGSLHTGNLLSTLSHAFATTISSSFGAASDSNASDPLADPGFDVIFGPAYKGIPLACTTVEALARLNAQRFGNISYCFDRKTPKTYGDGGRVVGAPMQGKRVLVVDDVITAGTAIREAMKIITEQGGTLVGIVVALDRQEKAPSAAEMGLDNKNGEEERMSAIGMVRKEFSLPVIAVLTLDDIIEGYKAIGTRDDIERLEDYREKYKAID